jgi:dolichol-phosphate mannosyltransferase
MVDTLMAHLPAKYRRVIGFLAVGGGVFISGAGLLCLLVSLLHIDTKIAYFIQAIYSIESNFLLNRCLNWSDRKGALASQWAKFHLAKVGTVAIDQAVFAGLISIGMNYLVAKLVLTATLTLINYFVNNCVIFTQREAVIYVSQGRHSRAMP